MISTSKVVYAVELRSQNLLRSANKTKSYYIRETLSRTLDAAKPEYFPRTIPRATFSER